MHDTVYMQPLFNEYLYNQFYCRENNKIYKIIKNILHNNKKELFIQAVETDRKVTHWPVLLPFFLASFTYSECR